MTCRRSPVDGIASLRFDRRRFASLVGRGAGGVALSGLFGDRLARGLAIPDIEMQGWVPDIDGDGHITEDDLRAVRAAMSSRRGSDLLPPAGYDHRADLFGRGRVGTMDLDAVQNRLRSFAKPIERPVTVGWHYAWYHKRHRVGQTASFRGGDYLSDDPGVEHVFNRLKNEFGISVDALSWISPRVDPRILQNLSRGYFAARNLPSRHVALLYESTINLAHEGERIDFTSTNVSSNLIDDFERMAGMLRHNEDDNGARLFRIDGRPVIFIYGSHTWLSSQSAYEMIALDGAIAAARDRFEDVLGQPPFLIGEEMPLAPTDTFSADRERRARNFDALFLYHHVASPWNIIHGGKRLGPAYAQAQQELLDRNLAAMAGLRNRFTNRPLAPVPSLAAGFAKKGLRKLTVSRDSYASYLASMLRWHARWLQLQNGESRAAFRFPIYTVGSWNEEFEGHALFPFAENSSVKPAREHGFDLLMALKQNFGWNRYAQRAYPGSGEGQ